MAENELETNDEACCPTCSNACDAVCRIAYGGACNECGCGRSFMSEECALCGLPHGDIAFDIRILAENFEVIATNTTDDDIRHFAKRAVTHLAHVRALYEEISDLNECGK